MSIRYICGYRGTGKDTLCDQINNGYRFDYEVYTRLSQDQTRDILTRSGTRVAFADALKRMIAEKHGISVNELNSNKEAYRQELIDLGQSMKAVDQTFWVKQSNLLSVENPIVTDFRFPYENIYNAVTIRVFRKEVKVHEVVSEIDLDEYETDIVIVPPGQYEAMIDRFPQYGNHETFSL